METSGEEHAAHPERSGYGVAALFEHHAGRERDGGNWVLMTATVSTAITSALSSTSASEAAR